MNFFAAGPGEGCLPSGADRGAEPALLRPDPGLGLMVGITVQEGWTNKDIAARLIENGLLVLTAGPGMRLLPPLAITKEEMDEAIAAMREVF